MVIRVFMQCSSSCCLVCFFSALLTRRSLTHTFDNHSHPAGVPKLERGSNYGEPTLLTSASRCGNMGPLLRLGERTTTPDPSGEYDETRGGRPQDVRVSIETRSPALCRDARRRRTMSRSTTSRPKLTTQLRRADKAQDDGLPR